MQQSNQNSSTVTGLLYMTYVSFIFIFIFSLFHFIYLLFFQGQQILDLPIKRRNLNGLSSEFHGFCFLSKQRRVSCMIVCQTISWAFLVSLSSQPAGLHTLSLVQLCDLSFSSSAAQDFSFKMRFFDIYRYILLLCYINSCLPKNTKFEIEYTITTYVLSMKLGYSTSY